MSNRWCFRPIRAGFPLAALVPALLALAPATQGASLGGCRFVQENLLACPGASLEHQLACQEAGRAACEGEGGCLREAMDACLSILESRPSASRHDGIEAGDACTLAATWERIVLHKGVDEGACPGTFLHTDEGFHCILEMPSGRRHRWTRLDDRSGFIALGANPFDPAARDFREIAFQYDTSVPSATLSVETPDGTFAVHSFCD